MLAATTATINSLNQSTTVSMTNGCHIEYNMNDLISGVTAMGPGGTTENPSGSLAYTNPSGVKVFDKLFRFPKLKNQGLLRKLWLHLRMQALSHR